MVYNGQQIKMKKKYIAILTMVLFAFSSQAQNIIQISSDKENRENSNQKKECEYKINGICSTEDIGGVDVDFNFDQDKYYEQNLVLTNYNNSTVTVLWELEYNGDASECNENDTKTGSTVIKASETKEVSLHKCYKGRWSLKGMIVRKIK